jgi:hypothetical protein
MPELLTTDNTDILIISVTDFDRKLYKHNIRNSTYVYSKTVFLTVCMFPYEAAIYWYTDPRATIVHWTFIESSVVYGV